VLQKTSHKTVVKRAAGELAERQVIDSKGFVHGWSILDQAHTNLQKIAGNLA
jgi:hypothetical protein